VLFSLMGLHSNSDSATPLCDLEQRTLLLSELHMGK
jgi:hypothetical protein